MLKQDEDKYEWLLHALGECPADSHECWYDTISDPTNQDIYEYIKSYLSDNYVAKNKIFYGGGISDLDKMIANGEIVPDEHFCACDCHKHAPQDEHCSLC